MTLFRLTAPSVFAAGVALLATGCFTEPGTDSNSGGEEVCADTTSACDAPCTKADADIDPDCDEAPVECEDTTSACDDGCTECDAGDIEIDPDCADDCGDTAWGFMFTGGTIAGDESGVAATFGYSAFNFANETFLCDMYAEYAGTEAGWPDCPECSYSFKTEVTGGSTEGVGCDLEINAQQDVFGGGHEAWWWYDGGIQDGWGFSPAYTYVASDGGEYFLENVVFGHINYDGTNDYYGWYFKAWDQPANGQDFVDQDADPMTFSTSWIDDAGAQVYYYFYY